MNRVVQKVPDYRYPLYRETWKTLPKMWFRTIATLLFCNEWGIITNGAPLVIKYYKKKINFSFVLFFLTGICQIRKRCSSSTVALGHYQYYSKLGPIIDPILVNICFCFQPTNGLKRRASRFFFTHKKLSLMVRTKFSKYVMYS